MDDSLDIAEGALVKAPLATRLLPVYDSGDHLRVNDAGNIEQGSAVPLTLFASR